jgi:outer membrane protein assembly factor BamB
MISNKKIKKYFSVLLVFTLCTLWPSLALCSLSYAEWPSLRNGSEGKASLRYTGPQQIYEWYYNYKTTIRYRPGLAMWSSPALAIVDEKPVVFIGGHNQTLLALNVIDRRVKWLKITNGEIGAAPAIGRVADKDIVFFGSADRTIYALEANTGNTFWTRELIPPSTTLGTVTISSPLLHQDRLYITCFAYDKSLPRNQQNTKLYCLDIQNGKLFWEFEIGQGFVSSPNGFYLDDTFHIVVAARKGLVQCFALTDQQPKRIWTYQMPHEVFGAPVIENNLQDPFLFLGSKFGNFVALNARTGKKEWQHMAGNWVDNSACIGQIKGQNVVYVGSHDYKLYAFLARTGEILWKRPLGGEIYSAPTFYHVNEAPMVAVACLDDRVYALNAESGTIQAAFFSGAPVWDKIPKGETLMGSPVVVEAGRESAIVHGSYSGSICVFPLVRDSMFRDTSRSFTSLWLSLPIVLLIFLGIILPIVLRIKN